MQEGELRGWCVPGNGGRGPGSSKCSPLACIHACVSLIGIIIIIIIIIVIIDASPHILVCMWRSFMPCRPQRCCSRAMMHAIICGEASMMMIIMTMMMHAAPCNFIMGRWLPQDRQSLQVPQRILDAEPSRPTDGEGGGEEQEA